MNHKIKFEILDEDENTIIKDSTFVEPENITSAEDTFYRILRHYDTQLKNEEKKEELIDLEIKDIKEENV